MSIFDMFQKKAEPQQQSNNQQTNNNQQNNNQQDNTAKPNGMTNGGSAEGNASNPPNQQTNNTTNPLDIFKGMYDTPDSSKEVKAPRFNLPADKLAEVTKSMNFTSNADPELMAKALSGDTKALVDLINHAGQQSYSNSMSHLSGLSDEYMNSRLSFEDKSFGSKVKQELTNSELSANTTNFNHPIVKQQLTDTARALSKQHPDASPQEIAKMAKDYITTLAQAINPPQQTQEQALTASQVTDWGKYLDK